VFEGRIKHLENTVKLRESAKWKLAQQALQCARGRGDRYLKCYMNQQEQDALHMPLIRSSPAQSNPQLSKSVSRKLLSQVQVSKNKKDNRNLALTPQGQRAIAMEPISTVEVVVSLGGTAQVHAVLNKLQRTLVSLAPFNIFKGDAFAFGWQQRTLSELNSIFGQSGETHVECEFVPSRTLVRTAAQRAPQPLRSYMAYPQDMVGQAHS
jgi:hypothetical protein